MNLEEALDVINELGLGLGKTYSKDFELKGYKIDREDGGSCKFYLQAGEIQQLAEAFSTIAAIATGGVSEAEAERARCAQICADIAGEVDWPARGIMQMDAEQVGIECACRIRGEK